MATWRINKNRNEKFNYHDWYYYYNNDKNHYNVT